MTGNERLFYTGGIKVAETRVCGFAQDQQVKRAGHINVSTQGDITAGQYYFASFYLGELYSPAGFVAFSICSGLFFNRWDIAAALIVIAAFTYNRLTWIHDRYVAYFNRMGSGGYVRYDLISGLLVIGLILFLAYLDPGKINVDILIWLVGSFVVGTLFSIIFYFAIWPRLGGWYGRQDRNVFMAEYAEPQEENTKKGRKLSAAAAREKVRQQRWRTRERRYVARLKLYKCSAVLPKSVILFNLAVFYFAIDGYLEPNEQSIPLDIGFVDGLIILTILAVSHVGWWFFIRNDERVEDATYVMGAASRLFIDIEWLIALILMPCGLLGYSLLLPGSGMSSGMWPGMLPWQSSLYLVMATAQFALFLMYLYPGHAPE